MCALSNISGRKHTNILEEIISGWWEYGCLISFVMPFCISRVSRIKCIAFTTGNNEKGHVRPSAHTDSAVCGLLGPRAASPFPLSPKRPPSQLQRGEVAYQVGLFLLALQDELLKVLGHLVGGHVLLQLLHDGDVQVPLHIQLFPDGLVDGL